MYIHLIWTNGSNKNVQKRLPGHFTYLKVINTYEMKTQKLGLSTQSGMDNLSAYTHLCMLLQQADTEIPLQTSQTRQQSLLFSDR